MADPTSTADYRKYPKGPNFLLIVLLSTLTFVLLLVAAWLLIGERGKSLLPKRSHPDPHSLLVHPVSTVRAA